MILDQLRQRLVEARAAGSPAKRIRTLRYAISVFASRNTTLKGMLLAHNRPGDHPGGGESGSGAGGSASGKASPAVKEWAEKRFANPEHAKAFTEWFGDSKVVDENGHPLVVYHGTGSAFDEFEGISWFTKDAEFANDYASVREGSSGGANVVPAMLQIREPYIPVGQKHQTIDDLLANIENQASEQRSGINFEAVDKAAAAVNAHWNTVGMGGTELAIHEHWNTVDKQGRDLLTTYFKANGFDGIHFTELGHDTWATFEPTQIKSATGNKGTFDPTNPKITARLTPRIVSVVSI